MGRNTTLLYLEKDWGVFGVSDCPDLGRKSDRPGVFPKYFYEDYPESPEMFALLMKVQDTFRELNLRPHPDLQYPTNEEVQTWDAWGEESWRKRNKLL